MVCDFNPDCGVYLYIKLIGKFEKEGMLSFVMSKYSKIGLVGLSMEMSQVFLHPHDS